MKLHIVLRKGISYAEAFQNVQVIANLHNVNEMRARRFGIVTGETDATFEEVVAKLRAMEEVESVEPDEERRTVEHHTHVGFGS